MQDQADAVDPAERQERPDDFWVWPLRDEPRVALTLLLGLAAVSAVVWRMSGPLLGSGVMVALLTCTWRMWCASCMRIDNRGAGQQTLIGWRRLGWPEITRCERRARGLLLHAGEPSPLSAASGMYLRYGRHRQQLIEAVACHCPELLGLPDPTAFEVGAPPRASQEPTP